MAKESIVDASVPSAGRIYDYYLGGHHNFEVDRQAAQRLIELMPFVPKMARLQRWCLQDIAHELTKVRGYNIIIDFASGLPTQDHIHMVVPKGTTVIYSDYDPVVVEYAREILGDADNIHYFEADARRPAELLNNPRLLEIVGSNRNVAVVYWGVAIFLDDNELSHVADTLYDWMGANGCWVFNAQAAGAGSDPEIVSTYQRMGTPAYVRSLLEYERLIKPWKPDHQGFVSLLEWHGLNLEMTQRDIELFGPSGGGYGAFLVK